MVNFQHRRDRALVRFCGELTREATVDLVETIDMLVRVYFYVLIEIQISSLGGASSALEHYLDAHRRWRAAGVRVRTRPRARSLARRCSVTRLRSGTRARARRARRSSPCSARSSRRPPGASGARW